jgi:hypothetical protein
MGISGSISENPTGEFCELTRHIDKKKCSRWSVQATTPGVEPGISRGGDSQPKSSALAIRPRGRWCHRICLVSWWFSACNLSIESFRRSGELLRTAQSLGVELTLVKFAMMICEIPDWVVTIFHKLMSMIVDFASISLSLCSDGRLALYKRQYAVTMQINSHAYVLSQMFQSCT